MYAINKQMDNLRSEGVEIGGCMEKRYYCYLVFVIIKV